MSSKIGKVTLNYDYYDGTELSSGTDIENRLLELFKSGEDVEEVLLNETDGDILYHLSDMRKNLLSWYPIDKNASVLEIGSECGALTGLFCEKAKRVVAVEPSKAGSEINAYRNNYDNLEIIVGLLSSIKMEERFDCVTLIGALDKAESLVCGKEPQKVLVRLATELLAPGGVLIVATKNKYGLKYWSGATEAGSKSIFTDSDRQGSSTSFTRRSLIKTLEKTGIGMLEMYYPVPDYKLPLYIYTDETLPDSEIINTETVEYMEDSFKLFNERRVSDELLKDGIYADFANSFLVIGRK